MKFQLLTEIERSQTSLTNDRMYVICFQIVLEILSIIGCYTFAIESPIQSECKVLTFCSECVTMYLLVSSIRGNLVMSSDPNRQKIRWTGISVQNLSAFFAR